MKRQLINNMLYSMIVCSILFLVSSCGGGTPAPAGSTPPTPTPTQTVAQQIAKIWSVTNVKEDGITVFISGGTANIKVGYLNFKLDLSSVSAAKLTEYDGKTITGKWSVSADGKSVTLTDLVPEPTDTSGTISYTINSVADKSFKITRNVLNRKTGATKTEYELTTP
jgi:hypothetical protein